MMQSKDLGRNSMSFRTKDGEVREAEKCLKSSAEKPVAVLGVSNLTFEHISSLSCLLMTQTHRYIRMALPVWLILIKA